MRVRIFNPTFLDKRGPSLETDSRAKETNRPLFYVLSRRWERAKRRSVVDHPRHWGRSLDETRRRLEKSDVSEVVKTTPDVQRL